MKYREMDFGVAKKFSSQD